MNREIPLTQGKVALVDEADYNFLMQWKWFAWKNTGGQYYAGRRVRIAVGKQATVHMHRAILSAPDGMQVDHVNHETLDNRRENLRLATFSQNTKNRKRYKNNTSGIKGVSLYKPSQKWIAIISVDGKFKHLGYYVSKEAAAHAYAEAAHRFHGDFACLG